MSQPSSSAVRRGRSANAPCGPSSVRAMHRNSAPSGISTASTRSGPGWAKAAWTGSFGQPPPKRACGKPCAPARRKRLPALSTSSMKNGTPAAARPAAAWSAGSPPARTRRRSASAARRCRSGRARPPRGMPDTASSAHARRSGRARNGRAAAPRRTTASAPGFRRRWRPHADQAGFHRHLAQLVEGRQPLRDEQALRMAVVAAPPVRHGGDRQHASRRCRIRASARPSARRTDRRQDRASAVKASASSSMPAKWFGRRSNTSRTSSIGSLCAGQRRRPALARQKFGQIGQALGLLAIGAKQLDHRGRGIGRGFGDLDQFLVARQFAGQQRVGEHLLAAPRSSRRASPCSSSGSTL